MPPNFPQQPTSFPPKENPPSPVSQTPVPPRPVVQTPPSVMPTIQMHPSVGMHNKVIKPLITVLVVAIVLAGAYAIFQTIGNKKIQKISGENVELINNNKTVPAGIPNDLFIDLPGIIQSNTLSYLDKKIILYSLSFNTTKQAEELYVIYGKYLADKQYQMISQSKSSSLMFYNASKGNNSLLISIVPNSFSAIVQLSYSVQEGDTITAPAKLVNSFPNYLVLEGSKLISSTESEVQAGKVSSIVMSTTKTVVQTLGEYKNILSKNKFSISNINSGTKNIGLAGVSSTTEGFQSVTIQLMPVQDKVTIFRVDYSKK